MCSTLACALVRSVTSRSGAGFDFAALAMVLGYDGAGGRVKAVTVSYPDITFRAPALARVRDTKSSRRRLEQTVRGSPRLGGDLGAGEHPRDLLAAVVGGKRIDAGRNALALVQCVL